MFRAGVCLVALFVLRPAFFPEPLVPRALPEASAPQATASASEEVRKAEQAFAKTMADRDYKAFSTFVAEDAIFVGDRETFRGRQAVVEGWKRFYEGPTAPFSWSPEQVEVVESGTLALSTGPVFDSKGARVGTFISTWRRDPDGKWRVVLDKGCPHAPAQ